MSQSDVVSSRGSWSDDDRVPGLTWPTTYSPPFFIWLTKSMRAQQDLGLWTNNSIWGRQNLMWTLLGSSNSKYFLTWTLNNDDIYENLRVNLMKYQSLAQRSPVSILERREDVETSDEWETENDGHSSCSHLVKLFFIPVRHHLIEERWGPSWRWFLWDRWGWCARRRSGMLVWS